MSGSVRRSVCGGLWWKVIWMLLSLFSCITHPSFHHSLSLFLSHSLFLISGFSKTGSLLWKRKKKCGIYFNMSEVNIETLSLFIFSKILIRCFPILCQSTLVTAFSHWKGIGQLQLFLPNYSKINKKKSTVSQHFLLIIFYKKIRDCKSISIV